MANSETKMHRLSNSQYFENNSDKKIKDKSKYSGLFEEIRKKCQSSLGTIILLVIILACVGILIFLISSSQQQKLQHTDENAKNKMLFDEINKTFQRLAQQQQEINDQLTSLRQTLKMQGLAILNISTMFHNYKPLMMINPSNLPLSFYIDYCSVGVKDGRVKDAQMNASSEWNKNHAARNGRLDYGGSSSPFRSGAWCAKNYKAGEWLQVDLLYPTFVTGLITQRRAEDTWGVQTVTNYKIAFANQTESFQYATDGLGNEEVYSGNTDQNTYIMHKFDHPITARYFRLVVQSWQTHISVRLEYITC